MTLRKELWDLHNEFRQEAVSSEVQEEFEKQVVELLECYEFGYCPDCDERIGEPMVDESRL